MLQKIGKNFNDEDSTKCGPGYLELNQLFLAKLKDPDEFDELIWNPTTKELNILP